MTITIGNSGAGESNAIKSVTANLTTAAGDNFIIAVVGRAGTGLIAAKSAAFDGAAFTKLFKVDNTNVTIELWYLANPSITAGSVVVTYPAAEANADHWLVVQALGGVNTYDPIRGYETATATSTSLSDTIAGAVGDLAIDGCSVYMTSAVPVQDAGQTLVDTAGNNSLISISGGMSYETGAVSNTLGWSWGTSQNAAQIIVAIKALGIPSIKTPRGINLLGRHGRRLVY